VLAMDEIATREWEHVTEKERADIEDVMCYVLFEFCSLRGEEVPMISLSLFNRWRKVEAVNGRVLFTILS
jgi:hypothetical protein